MAKFHSSRTPQTFQFTVDKISKSTKKAFLSPGRAVLFDKVCLHFHRQSTSVISLCAKQTTASSAPGQKLASTGRRSSSSLQSNTGSKPLSSTTTIWPCKHGQLVRVKQVSDATIEISVTGLLENQSAELLWGVYRSSPHAWQHPQTIVVPDSRTDDSTGTMASPMCAHTSTSQTISIQIPPGLAPITFAFLIAIVKDSTTDDVQSETDRSTKKKKRQFIVPIQGRHFSVLIGAAPGFATPLGPSLIGLDDSSHGTSNSSSSVNFAVRSRGGEAVSLVLIQKLNASHSGVDADTPQYKVVELALDPCLNRTGDTWHIALPKLRNVETLYYGWRIDGDVSWESGYRIQPHTILLDPYAPCIAYLPLNGGDADDSHDEEAISVPPLPRVEVPLGGAIGSINSKDKVTKMMVAGAVSGVHVVRAAQNEGVSPALYRPLEKVVALEIDIPTFTQQQDHHHYPDDVYTHPGTFLGVAHRINFIRALGANTVILSPCYATSLDTIYGFGSRQRVAVSFCAPDPMLSTDPGDPSKAYSEFKSMVKDLHKGGIEVLLSFDLTFMADGIDAHSNGVLSLRGLDHKSYFRPNGVLNCGHPATQALIIHSLRHWALEFGVDGFCFINAENMVLNVDGLVVDAPALPDALCQDPVLAGLKLVAAPSNEALLPRGGVRGFPHWGLWQERNASFARDMAALLVEANHLAIDGVAARLTGSADIFGPGWTEDGDMPGNLATHRRPSFSFNAVTRVHGQSARELAEEAAGAAMSAVQASGGGPMPSALTIAKSLLVATLMAQGVPLINGADVADVEMARFVGVVARLRRKIAHLLLPPRFDSPRDISWHSASCNEPEWIGSSRIVGEQKYERVAGASGDGSQPPQAYTAPHGSSYLAFSVRHPDGSAVYVGFNPHALMVMATLPAPPSGHTWLRAVDTGLAPPHDVALSDFVAVEGQAYGVSGKAAIVLIAAIVEHL